MPRRTPTRSLCAALALAALAGCVPRFAGPDVTGMISPTRITLTTEKPPADTPEVCWGHVPAPKVTEVVSDTIVATPAKKGPDGEEISPAIYREVTRPRSAPAGDGHWFIRICDAELTPDFVKTLQRALSARDLYTGKINGVMDRRTLRAVQDYQSPQGLDSTVLSLSAARQLGLVAVELDRPQVPEETAG